MPKENHISTKAASRIHVMNQHTDELPPDFPRTWVEFPDPGWQPGEGANDPTRTQPEQVFRCDITWLTSSWTCIFGAGCRGLYDTRPTDGCCTHGAQFTDDDDVERVARYAEQLTTETWQRRPVSEAEPLPLDMWTEPDGEELGTAVRDGACIFLNDPGFPAGDGCALHHLSQRLAVPALMTKPDVCWQLPIRRSYREVTRPDESTYLEVTVAEYDRRGWGPGGHDLDWYCSTSPAAHCGDEPVFMSAAAELIELMGKPAYDVLAGHCREHMAQNLSLSVHPATATNRCRHER